MCRYLYTDPYIYIYVYIYIPVSMYVYAGLGVDVDVDEFLQIYIVVCVYILLPNVVVRSFYTYNERPPSPSQRKQQKRP